MSLVVNTNVSSLTAQRALAYADSLQSEAMQRLSTGSKINSASDDAAGLAIAQRMTSQVNGLNMAVKNANDGIALTQSIEGSLVEVADMLQRLRALSIQAANDTNTGVDRKAIQEEVDLLIAEITRVSNNTRFNNTKVLDGSFQNVQLQVGTQAGEAITFGLESTSADLLGSYKVTGDIIQADIGAGSGVRVNQTDDADDIIINGNSVSKTIDVAVMDSAKQVAAKINAVSGETGVTAEAKTHAKLYSMNGADQTHSLLINGTTTGDFVMSSTSVSDAIDKINSISGTTGVTASANSSNQVVLYSADGSDILVENQKSLTSLRMKTVGFDGLSEVKTLAAIAKKSDNAALDSSEAHIFRNNTSGVDTTFTTGTTHTANEYNNLINTALGAINGTAANRVSTTDIGSIALGSYYLKSHSTGDVFKLNLATADVSGWETALSGATHFGGDHDTIAHSLADEVTVSVVGGSNQKVQLTGSRLFGDFDVYSDSITSLNIMDTAHTYHRAGVEGTGVEVTQAAGAAGAVGANAMVATITGNGSNHAGALTLADAAAGGGAAGFDSTTKLLTVESKIHFTVATATVATNATVVGEDRDGNAMSETVVLTAAGNYQTKNQFLKVDSITLSANVANSATITVHATDLTTNFQYRSNRNVGDFDIMDTSATTAVSALNKSTNVVGDVDTMDAELATQGALDAATVQGTIALSSSKLFSVSQSSTEVSYSTSNNSTPSGTLNGKGPKNDNYFTTGAATLNTVSNVDLRSQTGASNAISVIDGAIAKISSVRSDLGAIENRLEHTVSNLMNISEKTEAARSRIQDADFAAESAKLSKAQVLKQAGVGMLAQANASSQLVLQLLQ